MTFSEVEKRMREIEFKMQNMQDSFNPQSGKQIDFERAMDKLYNEYLTMGCARALLLPYEEITYQEVTEDVAIIMSKQEFTARCGEGEFSDENGFGFYVHNDTVSMETENVEVKASWALSNKLRRDFNQVAWYFTKDIEVDNLATNTLSFEDIEEEF